MTGQSALADKNLLYPNDFGILYADYQDDPTVESIKNATWTDVGPLSDVPAMESTSEVAMPKSATYEHDEIVNKRNAKLDFMVQQISPEMLTKILCGFLKREVVPATPVTGKQDDYPVNSFAKGDFIPFSKQHYPAGVLTVPASIVVEQDYDTTPITLTLYADYHVVFFNGKWGVYIDSDGTFAAAKNLRIEYDVTPLAIDRVYKTDITAIGKIMFKAYKKVPKADGGFKVIEIYFPNCQPTKDFSIKGQARDSADYNEVGLSYNVKFHNNFLYNSEKVLEFSEFYDLA